MARRRTEYNSLEPTGQPRWLVVRTVHGRIMNCRLLPPGAHIQREFVASILSHIDEGWVVGEFSSHAAYYAATKPNERIEVTITATDPSKPQESMYGR
jgi:hypothetical protein